MRTLLVCVLAVAIARAQAPVRLPLPVPDLPGFRTLKGDFHLHTVFSDGNVWPSVHVQEAWRDGLDVIALTEHAECTIARRRLSRRPAIPMRIAVRRAPDWLILAGTIQLDAQGVAFLRPAVTADAPAGEHRIDLQLEVLNLHVAPDRNLTAALPLTVQVERSPRF